MKYGFRTNFTVDTIQNINYALHYQKGKEIFDKQNKQIAESVAQYEIQKNTLSVKKIEADYFPIPDNIDVFISHSHKDLNFAIAFAGCLKYYLGLNCFIDSCLWNNVDDLMRIVANEYCVMEKYENGIPKTYGYDSINKASSNVHMILSMALTNVINKSEVFCFIGTENSATFKETMTGGMAKTFSPWIYLELMISKLLSKDKEYFKRIASNFSDSPQFQYEVLDTKHLFVLTDEKFEVFINSPLIKKDAIMNLFDILDK
jgi:hypothetical protein